MEHRTQIRTASLLTALLGGWVALSLLFISVTGAALANTIIVGLLLVVFGLLQLLIHSSVPSWLNGFAGMWLFVSAFVFTVTGAMASNLILCGLLAVILALWDSSEVEETYHPIGAA